MVSPWLPLPWFVLWAAQAWATGARLRDLEDLPRTGASGPLPTVTLCVPARDEERELARALDSWLAQDCPGLRIVVVDDGSTDRTPAILAERAGSRPGRLRVLRNDQLPAGWLGKNHALDLASRQPEALAADWLLFADADVQATPDLLRRAFAFLEQHPVDLLTVLPAIDAVTWAERMFMPVANLVFLWLMPPRRVADPRSRCCCGVGGFMLVRRAAYDAVAGHAGAPMAAVDDMLLAHRIKAAGYVNRMALGGPELHLRMYHGAGEILHGLRKNLLALPFLFPLAPLLMALALLGTLGCVLVALTGHPGLGLLLWLLVPPLMAEVNHRFTHGPADLAWAFWPLSGVLVAVAIGLAFFDRLRGVNHWRGREVDL
ncbi:MAG: glycosyltransferase family 2 protein [Holophaga sp.]|nr:glycosyltransferase family 2 protein [Holophaga sp.]